MASSSRLTEPKVVTRAAQAYLGITALVTMRSIADHVDKLFPELFEWLATRHIPFSGAPFIKYNIIDMDGDLEIEVAAPIGSDMRGDARVREGTLPAGRYASLSHFGGFDGLVGANAALQDWAVAQGLSFDIDKGWWAARLEMYHTDPRTEPDKTKWETEVSYKLAERR